MDARVAELIAASDNIVFFGGAGVSTESGIPDFRSKSGLYHAEKVYGYSPETILSADFYYEHNDLFYKYYKENLIHTEAKPNAAHRALAKLEQDGKLKAVVTQNIDGLHQMAGSKTVYELHGSIHRNTCEKCGAAYDLDYVMSRFHSRGDVPYCSRCGGRIKPDVVLYGEMLDEAQIGGAVDAISRADLLIIGGTSLSVYPAASFINYFRGSHLVLINKSKTLYDDRADLVITDAIGKVLGI